MKKTLLFGAALLLSSLAINAQTVWNFSNAPFGANPTVTFSSTFTTPDGLTVGTDGTVLWTGLSANSKTIDGVSYTVRLQTGGGGAPLSPSRIPTTRYLKISVSGASTIKLGMISSSSTAIRSLIIVNTNETVVDSITGIGGAAAATYTYNYTGGATTLYFYSRASGLNYYYVSATNVIVTNINNPLADKGITFNGKQIVNNQGLPIEVFNVMGKKVATTNSSITTQKLGRGVFFVRAVGGHETLKFNN